MCKAHYQRGLPGRALAQGSSTSRGLTICNWGMWGEKNPVLPPCTCIRELFSWAKAKAQQSFPSFIGNGKTFEYGGWSCREMWNYQLWSRTRHMVDQQQWEFKTIFPTGSLKCCVYSWCIRLFLSNVIWCNMKTIWVLIQYFYQWWQEELCMMKHFDMSPPCSDDHDIRYGVFFVDSNKTNANLSKWVPRNRSFFYE